jgi:hypothetical protein
LTETLYPYIDSISTSGLVKIGFNENARVFANYSTVIKQLNALNFAIKKGMPELNYNTGGIKDWTVVNF